MKTFYAFGMMLLASLGCYAQNSVVYPDGSTFTLSDGSSVTKTGETISATASNYNVVQVTSGNLTLNDCTLQKSGDTSSSGDDPSFYGVNSVLFVGPTDSTKYSAKCTMTGGTITADSKGSNTCFVTRGGVLNVSGVTLHTTNGNSRGLHATFGGHINASDINITTEGQSCSTIATDTGGGYIYVTRGTSTAKGVHSSVLYSTGVIEVTGITGKSEQGEIASVEGDNHVVMTNCAMTSGSSERGLMMLKSMYGTAEDYTAYIKVNNSTLTTTGEETPLCEVPTCTMGSLTLSDASLSVKSGVLMKVDYNTQWQEYGGKGRLILTTTKGTADEPWIYTGAVTADSYSCAAVIVDSNTLWYGTIDNASTAKGDTVTVSGTWVLDSDANVDKLVINEGGMVFYNGHTLTCGDITNNGTIDETSTGLTYEQTWSPSFSITYNGCEGIVTNSNVTSYDGTEDVTLVDPEKAGYNFVGWTYIGQAEPTKSVTIVAGSTGDKAFTANWTPCDTTVTTMSNGWAYFSNIEYGQNVKILAPAKGVEVAKAYVCSEITAKVAKFDAIDIMPSDGAYFIKGAPNTEYTLQVTEEEDVEGFFRNYIMPVYADTELSSYAYILDTRKIHRIYNIPGLYYINTSTTLKEGQAYIDVPTTIKSPALMLRMVINTPTGIDNVDADALTDSAQSQVPGKYITDGKLVIVKNGKQYNAAGQEIEK